MSTPTLPTAAFGPLLEAPQTAGIFTDFDGTLSEIVDEPDDARPVPGSVEALSTLAAAFRLVGVLSGRPVAFLQPMFPPTVLLAGLYGLERLVDGERADHPMGGNWREVIDDVGSLARVRGPEGMRVENKGVSLTLHYRGRADLEPEVRAFAEAQAMRSGLQCRPARMSFELHPPISTDKGSALVELSEGLDAVAFIGDDLGDLSAFDALDQLARDGLHTVKVAVHSTEESPELISRADVVVEDPRQVRDLVQYLAANTPQR